MLCHLPCIKSPPMKLAAASTGTVGGLAVLRARGNFCSRGEEHISLNRLKEIAVQASAGL